MGSHNNEWPHLDKSSTEFPNLGSFFACIQDHLVVFYIPNEAIGFRRRVLPS